MRDIGVLRGNLHVRDVGTRPLGRLWLYGHGIRYIQSVHLRPVRRSGPEMSAPCRRRPGYGSAGGRSWLSSSGARRRLDEERSVLERSVRVVVAIPAKRGPEVVGTFAQREETATGIGRGQAGNHLRADALTSMRFSDLDGLDF